MARHPRLWEIPAHTSVCGRSLTREAVPADVVTSRQPSMAGVPGCGGTGPHIRLRAFADAARHAAQSSRQLTQPAMTNRAITASHSSRARQARLIASRSSGSGPSVCTSALPAATPATA